MSDHINNDLTDDIAIASALRTFLSSPAITSLLQPLINKAVADAVSSEFMRRLLSDHILDTVTAALKHPDLSGSQARLSDTIGALIRADIEESTRYLLNEDSARDFIRDELESGPRYLIRAVESALEYAIDTDSIVDTVKDRVRENLDLDTDIADKVIDYFDDDDNLHSVTKRVIESISISITPSR
jgi:hypothetical protein